MIIRSDAHACYMRSERALVDRSLSAMIDTIHDTAETSVPVCVDNSDFAVMITGDKEILALIVRGEVCASHAINIDLIDRIKVSVRSDFIHFNAFISN